MKRSPSLILLAVLAGSVFGAVLSSFLGGLFPPGPVRSFFFQGYGFGFSPVELKLGFIALTVGLTFDITTFTVLLVALLVWAVGRL